MSTDGQDRAGRTGGRRLKRAREGEAPRVGGIALRNGLVLVSERFWAAAVREREGGIAVVSGRKPRLPGSGRGGRLRAGAGSRTVGGTAGRAAGESRVGCGPTGLTGLADGVPLLRGLSRFGESLLVLALVKLRLPQAELPLEPVPVLKALLGSAAGTSAVRRWAPKSALVQEAGAALAALVPALLSLRHSRVTAYHGAEHKIIASLERGVSGGGAAGRGGGQASGPLEVGRQGPPREEPAAPAPGPRGIPTAREPLSRPGAARIRWSPESADVATAAKEHDRCGTNVVGPLLAATVASNLLVRRLRLSMHPAASALTGAVSLGLALEALRWASRHGDSLVARLLLAPGRTMQRALTTREPSPEELEVARRAMAELLRLEGGGGRGAGVAGVSVPRCGSAAGPAATAPSPAARRPRGRPTADSVAPGGDQQCGRLLDLGSGGPPAQR